VEINQEIARFFAASNHSLPGLQQVTHEGIGYSLYPKGFAPLSGTKDFLLTLSALIHGTEVAGVRVLNEILAMIQSGSINLKVPLTLCLGNISAAKAGKRFLERDLNRSFGETNDQLLEEKRASALKPLLSRTQFLLDIHQTACPSAHPFFIFPYSKEAATFARAIAPDIRIVTHFKGFAGSGLCSDEFVNSQNGVGITIELGQNGFHPYQVAVGVRTALHAIDQVGRSWPKGFQNQELPLNDIFTFRHIEPWPIEGPVNLRPGLRNFQRVEKGESLGQIGSEDIICPIAGSLLFPKYLDLDSQKIKALSPSELYRVLGPIAASELSNV
jgi:succinylglutamate desuccinylase